VEVCTVVEVEEVEHERDAGGGRREAAVDRKCLAARDWRNRIDDDDGGQPMSVASSGAACCPDP